MNVQPIWSSQVILPSLHAAAHGLIQLGRTATSGRLGWVLRSAITAVLIGVILSRSQLHSLPAHLSGVNLTWVVVVLLCNYLAWAINSYKWQRLLAAYGLRHSIVEIFRLNLAAAFYGMALPGQVTGEVLKAIRMARGVDQRRAVYASVFLDRLTGLMGLAALGAAALLLDRSAAGDRFVVVPGLLLFVALLLVSAIVLSLLGSALPHKLLAGKLSPFSRLSAGLAEATGATGKRPSMGDLVGAVVLSVCFQAVVAWANWLAAVTLGIHVSLLAIAWIFAVVSLVQLLPISIAGFGPREATYGALLALYGVPAGLALTLSLFMFALLLLLGLTGGLMDLVGARPQPPGVFVTLDRRPDRNLH